ncbi:Secretory immunoglobulin A-binding protein EsiB [Pontiella desulfatans]|uniref:Secretory immunoglobulin A-binding protein EsiB n=1 Tax=Pontiella desulfatans TaxID=2750659 RepID=A0A6C2UAP4_PONDE|nr:SEL1-like repeat protein [Pontiella desulfatans]VGO16757.1 Secretory immunoglobulin A-binding protein EsiB [Pontiella desulfatans]
MRIGSMCIMDAATTRCDDCHAKERETQRPGLPVFRASLWPLFRRMEFSLFNRRSNRSRYTTRRVGHPAYMLALLLATSIVHGDADALYRQGAAVFESDPAKACGLFVQAAEQGNVSAMVGAGHCFETGAGAAKDYAKAIAWYEKAVAQNSLKACEGLARIYASCEDPEFHDGELAVKYASAVARKNPRDADALAILAAAHARNLDFAQAVKFQSDAVRYCSLEQASGFKERIAQYKRGIPEPVAASEVWILSAADQGMPWGLYMQGRQCLEKQEEDQAVQWFERAVAAGSAEAALELGDCHWLGLGAGIDYIKAAECYATATDAGVELGEDRAERMAYFDKVWERLEHSDAEECFEEGRRNERWIDEIVSRVGNNMDKEKLKVIRAAGLKRSMYCYAIAMAKGHAPAKKEFERIQGELNKKSSTTTPSVAAKRAEPPKNPYAKEQRPSRGKAADLVDEAVQARNNGEQKAAFDLFMESYSIDPSANNGYAAYSLWHYYRKGLPGVPEDSAQAEQWQLRAADNGHPEALHSVLRTYTETDANPEAAMEYAAKLLVWPRQNYRFWDVLAQAYALNGNFPKAVEFQMRAIEALKTETERLQQRHSAQYATDLEHYQKSTLPPG